jgi:hypothetical protein
VSFHQQRFASLDRLRREVLSRLAALGDRVLAAEWGTAPMTRADFIALSSRLSGVAQRSLQSALRRGLAERRHLWALVECCGSRHLVVTICYRYNDGWSIRATLSEKCGPQAMDVPPALLAAARRTTPCANSKWRAEVARGLRRTTLEDSHANT